MALLQVLISFVSRSARRVLNSIFGWAVVALFGRSSSRQQTLLTVIVALAAVWPLLVAGIVFPRIAAFVLTLVPVFDDTNAWIVRAVWIGLALAVPVTIGLVIAAKRPPGTAGDPWPMRVLRGFPITVGIAAAFTLMFFTVPVLRLASALRGRKDEHVVLITTADEYSAAARKIDTVLHRHDLAAVRAEPRWWLTLPTTILRKLGGKAFAGYMPERMAHWRGDGLELALYNSDLLVRGKPGQTAIARGLIAEAFGPGPGLMTSDLDAQRIEEEIREVWRIHDENPEAHDDSARLLSRLEEVAEEVAALEVDYSDWQVLYRKSLQLDRALRGRAQLLDASVDDAAPAEQLALRGATGAVVAQRRYVDIPTRALLKRAAKLAKELAKAELELAKNEVRADVQQQVAMAKGLGIAGVCVLIGLSLLSTAVVFALADTMEPWIVALLVAGVWLVTGVIFGVAGWSKRVTKPLENTRRTLQDDVRWLKNRLA